jgi:aryl-alcohol dehydrogenase-like predicted oxidoreductase
MLAIYNAIHRGIELELIPVCRRFGIEIVTYNPLAGSPKFTLFLTTGGFFSGKYKPNKVVDEGRFSSHTWYTGLDTKLMSGKEKCTKRVISRTTILMRLRSSVLLRKSII